jgi:tetratricopeptide (TPR) repeat protein
MAIDKSKPSNTKGAVASASGPPKKTEPVVLHPPPLFRNIDWFTLAATTLVVFIAYFVTLAPDLTLEDSGELAVASYYAGIPHPPGYPVWTLYTHLFAILIPFKNIAWRVAVGEAFAGALACGLLGFIVSRGSSMMMEGIAELKNIERRWENLICVVSGFVAGTLLGFNGYMWSQSVIVEVYSFSVLSMMGVLVCLLRWIYAPHQRRYLYWAFFMHGICFNNHQSLLVIALGMEVLIIAVDRQLAREFFFWNVVVYLGGLIAGEKGHLSVMTSNLPVFVIFNVIGLVSTIVWAWLSYSLKRPAAGILGLIVVLFGVFIQLSKRDQTDTSAVGATVALLWMIGWRVYEAYDAVAVRKHAGPLWDLLATILSGVAWILGTAFYFYMPIAGMTNPPMQWGYPRTVEGFFHAFTRGQYEKIHPTSGSGEGFEVVINFLRTYFGQIGIYLEGLNEEFNIVFLLIALVSFFFFLRMQKRERAWMIGIGAIFICLGPFLLMLLNPPPDRQAKELIRVFFTASHVLVAMGVGYGLTLIAASMSVYYERFRTWCWVGGAIAAALSLYSLASTTQTIFGEHPEMNPLELFFHALRKAFDKDQYAMPVYAGIILLTMTVVFTASVLIFRTRAQLGLVLAIFALMPLHSFLTHWFENEQRGHLFGYWFGHDMFTPPFVGPDGKFSYDRKLREEAMKGPNGKLVYPEMTRDAVLYGGTDPGRFCPTYMIFCESFIPPRCKPNDPNFDRRDVYIITQNALADGTYLNYIRAHYNRSAQKDPPFFQEFLRSPKARELNYETNVWARIAGTLLDKPLTKLGAKIEARRRQEGVYPPKEMYIASPDDSQRCFQEYLMDAQRRLQLNQLRPGEDVKIVENRVQVSGQVAVMTINGLLTKVMFDANPTNEFFVEESFPLDWMYPHLTPFGVIMKIERKPLPELSEEIVQRDHEFWSKYAERFIGNWITYDTPVKDIAAFVEKVYLRHDFSGFKGDRKFVRDDQAQKAFSKLRSSIGGVYAWRIGNGAPGMPPPAPGSPQQLRMIKEADFAFRQALAFCPYSPEAVFRYVNLLVSMQRYEDAAIVAETCRKLDPYNGQVVDLARRLKAATQPGAAIPQPQAQASLQQLENALRANPNDFQAAFNLAGAYMQLQQTGRAVQLLESIAANPAANPAALLTAAQGLIDVRNPARALQIVDSVMARSNLDATMIVHAAKIYAELGNVPKLEPTLERLVQVSPQEPAAWYDLAALKASLGKTQDSLAALRRSVELSDALVAKNPQAINIRSNLQGDTRFAAMRQLPEFKQILAPK